MAKRKSRNRYERVDRVIDRIAKAAADSLQREIRHLFRFSHLEESEAAVRLLQERSGEPMSLAEMVKELISGGLWREATGSKGSSAATEIKRAISQAARHGVNLKYVDKEKEIVGLVEK